MAAKPASTTTDTAELARRVKAARDMHPSAQIRVRRGRVVAVDGDLIRLVKYENLDAS